MVSADTVSPPIPPERASSTAMVVGESRATKRASTWSVNGRLSWNLVSLGRRRFLPARMDASAAQYRSRPPLRLTSWDTVDGARWRRRAMSVKDSHASNPTRISSRSCALSTAPAMLGPPTDRRSGGAGHHDRSVATTVGIRHGICTRPAVENTHDVLACSAHQSTRRVEEAPAVSYTHLRAHETRHDLVCRLLLEKK